MWKTIGTLAAVAPAIIGIGFWWGYNYVVDEALERTGLATGIECSELHEITCGPRKLIAFTWNVVKLVRGTLEDGATPAAAQEHYPVLGIFGEVIVAFRPSGEYDWDTLDYNALLFNAMVSSAEEDRDVLEEARRLPLEAVLEAMDCIEEDYRQACRDGHRAVALWDEAGLQGVEAHQEIKVLTWTVLEHAQEDEKLYKIYAEAQAKSFWLMGKLVERKNGANDLTPLLMRLAEGMVIKSRTGPTEG